MQRLTLRQRQGFIGYNSKKGVKIKLAAVIGYVGHVQSSTIEQLTHSMEQPTHLAVFSTCKRLPASGIQILKPNP